MVVKRLKNFIVTESDRYIRQSPTVESQEKWYKDGYFIKEDKVGYESIAEYVVSEFPGTDVEDSPPLGENDEINIKFRHILKENGIV